MTSPIDTAGGPRSAKEVIALTLQGLLATAALHLGETLPDGTAIAERDPQEAWRALLSATALVRQFAPMLHEGFARTLETLLNRFAASYPTLELPVPSAMLNREAL